MPVILGIYGESDSGKTILMTQLIQYCTKDGLRVAAIKMSSKDRFDDAENTDTFKFYKSGSNLTVFSGAKEYFFHGIKNLDELDIVNHCLILARPDVILVEGSAHQNIPKIRVGTIQPRPNTVMTYDGNIQSIRSYIQKSLSGNHQKNPDITLSVNGKKVPLSEFPTEIIMNVVVAMVKTLKGVEEPKNIVLHIH